MKIEDVKSLFLKYKEARLHNRYITHKHIEPLLNAIGEKAEVLTIGQSVLNNPIYGIKVGNGSKRILLWSQMHGNESTTTKALFDLLNTLLDANSKLNDVLQACTLYMIPILNPDGAQAYTRINANSVDLNRDAQNLTQPESQVLRTVFNTFRPHFCFNLHGQRTIFGAGNTCKSATVSFLAPAQDEACTVTSNRKVAMEVIGVMNNALQEVIPNQVGVYDDSFNINCVGDTFQHENIPTILFEAGHFENDYEREVTRELIYISYIASLEYISKNDVRGEHYESYMTIPENEKCFYDIIIRNAKVNNDSNLKTCDIAIQFQERLKEGRVEFIPKVEKIENLENFYGHKEIDANGHNVLDINNKMVDMNYENVFVIINNDKIALLTK